MKRKWFALFVRVFINFVPCIRGTGGRVIHISEDFTRLTVRLKLSWRTRNVVGTIFGGSMYASTDPFYMLMLMQILGKDFVVWDKGCTIRFKRPAKGTIYADFHVTPERLAQLRAEVESKGEATVTWPVAYRDRNDVTYAEFDKVLYVATKPFYKEKLRRREMKS